MSLRVKKRVSEATAFSIAVLLVLALAALDYLTGPAISFSIFYLIPVSISAWFVGRKSGVALAFLAAIVWLTVEMLGNQQYPSALIPYWNGAVRLGFFVVVSLVLSALHASRLQQEELAGFIVHDLQSPLANIISGLGSIKNLVEKNPNPAGKDLIRMSLANCQQMSIMIDSLLDLAKLEAGEMPFNAKLANLGVIIRASIEQVSGLASRKGLSFQLAVDTKNATVLLDEVLTTRILVNLLTNAIRFSPIDSSIEVRVQDWKKDTVSVSIIDAGPGIPRQWHAKVFDKFRQVEARRGGGAVGSGLGLAFCRRAVEVQGGEIWIEGKQVAGTAVTFTLPRSSSF